MLNLIHTRTFLTVIEMRGFRPAARQLGLAVSTVVGHIDQLETDLSALLLVRERGRVEPTLQGAIFLPMARALVETASRAHELVSRAPLRLAAASNIGVYMLQPSIAAFSTETGIVVEPWIGPNPAVVERLQSGLADIAFMEWWDGRAGFEALPWCREPLVVITARQHPLAYRRTISPADLVGYPILGGEAATGTGTVLRDAFGDLAGRLEVKSGYHSTEAVKRAVRAGQGISVVMAGAVAEEVAQEQLAIVKLRNTKLEKQLWLIVPKGLEPTSPAVRFMQHTLND